MSGHNKNTFLCYWINCIGCVDLFAVSMVFPLMPQYAKELGASPSLIGLYGSIYGAIQFFSSPVIGHFGDIKGRMSVLLVSLLIASAAYCTSSLCIQSLLLLSLLRCVVGIFKHTQDLCRICVADFSLFGRKTKAVSQFNAMASIGFIIGPSVSGLISKRLGLAYTISLCFFLCGMLFVANAAIVWFIVWPHSVGIKQTDCKKKNSGSSTWEKLKEINWKVHRGVFLSRFLFALAVLLYRSSFVLGIKHFFPHLTAAEVGYLVSYIGFLGFAFGMFVGWISTADFYAGNEEKMQMHAAILIPVSFLFIVISPNLSFMVLAIAMLSLGTATSRGCAVGLTTKRAKPDEAGKLLGLSSSVLSVARSAAPLVAGLAQEVSYSAPVVISAAISCLGLWIYYRQVYRVPLPTTIDHHAKRS